MTVERELRRDLAETDAVLATVEDQLLRTKITLLTTKDRLVHVTGALAALQQAAQEYVDHANEGTICCERSDCDQYRALAALLAPQPVKEGELK
jgi:hypothetical protein